MPERARTRGAYRAEDGVKQAEVITTQLVRTSAGWLRLAG